MLFINLYTFRLINNLCQLSEIILVKGTRENKVLKMIDHTAVIFYNDLKSTNGLLFFSLERTKLLMQKVQFFN